MTLLRRIASIVRWILHRDRAERDLAEEVEAFVDMASANRALDGVAPGEARRLAVLELGGVEQAKERVRAGRHGAWLDDVARDVRYGLRMLRGSPGFTAVALLTLVLGIGANIAIFTILNGVILRPLGYPKPEQLMLLTSRFPALTYAEYGLSPPEYMELRAMTRSFAGVGAFTLGEANLTVGDRPRRVRSASVDEHVLPTLGLRPARGRFFAAGETDPAAATPGLPPAIAVLSYELWVAAFDRRDLVGSTVAIDGRAYEIIGIAPPGADVMDNRTEIWLAIGLQPQLRRVRDAHFLSVVGRLKDGVTLEAAEGELGAIVETWAERAGVKGVGAAGHVPVNRPSAVADHIIGMRSVQDAVVGSAGRAIWFLQGAVGFVLLIACANLASLVVARAESRRREFAVRAALGAGRGRLLRQALTEGALLSLAGGVLGLWLAHTGVRALVNAYPESLPRTSDIAIDAPVLMFAFAVSVFTGTLFGLAPAVQGRLDGLVTALKAGHAGAASGAAHHRLRQVLIVTEVALALMLVLGAGLMVRTVSNLTNVDAGFSRSRLMTFSMSLPAATSEPETRARAYQRLLEKLRATPGVQAASAMSGLPPTRAATGVGTYIEHYVSSTGEPFEIADYVQYVMTDYFATMGIPIVSGRGFEPADVTSPGEVAVINETLADRVWRGRNPIGHRIRPGRSAPWHTVIGVAKDVKQGGVDNAAGTEVYMFVDERTDAPATMNVVLRTDLPPAMLSHTIESIVHDVDPAVPIVRLREMEAVFAESIRRPTLLAQLLGTFALLSLSMAAIGTYGVLSYMVAQRRREIGIRMALGAARSTVLAQVMSHGLLLAGLGIVAGLAGALALNRVVTSLLFDVDPMDATILGAVIPTIAAVAAVACWVPAWRAARLDPTVVLRAD